MSLLSDLKALSVRERTSMSYTPTETAILRAQRLLNALSPKRCVPETGKLDTSTRDRLALITQQVLTAARTS